MEPCRAYDNRAQNLSRYRGEIRSFPMFSSDVELTLYHRWRDNHDISAANQLVGKYLHLASKIAEGYAGCGVPLEDLIGEGCVGLMRALCRFDPGRGIRFTAYAAWLVREAIHEHIVRTLEMTLLQIAMLCIRRDEHGRLQDVGDAALRASQQQDCRSGCTRYLDTAGQSAL